MKRWTIWSVLVFFAAAGCRRELPRAVSTNESAKYAMLELTGETHDQELQAEISQLRAEGALPVLLDASRRIDPEIPRDASLAIALANGWNASKLSSALSTTDLLFASGADRWNPLTLERSLQFRAKHADAQAIIAHAINAPDARLDLPLAGSAKTSAMCSDATLLYVRLESIAAVDVVSQGRGDVALAALQRALHAVELLAAEPHVEARLTAAVARRDCLGAMQRLVDSRIVNVAQLAQLDRIVDAQLDAWPNDGDAWIGDRARGLQIYEMIRNGQLFAVLTSDELAAMQNRDSATVFAAAVEKNIDRDETYYLRAMRDYIALANKPFYERVARFESLQIERNSLANSPHYPIIADRLMLRGIAEGQRQQASDLALVQAWSMALAVACGQSLPPPNVNPLTGEKYQVRIVGNCIVVAGIDPRLPELQVTAPIAQAIRTTSRRSDIKPHQPR